MTFTANSTPDLNSVSPDFDPHIFNEVLSQAWRQVRLELRSFANLPESEALEKLRLAFGSSFSEENALNIIHNWRNDNWEDLPSVEFLSSNEFNGAFSREAGKIYLSEGLLTGVVSQFESLAEIKADNQYFQELVTVWLVGL